VASAVRVGVGLAGVGVWLRFGVRVGVVVGLVAVRVAVGEDGVAVAVRWDVGVAEGRGESVGVDVALRVGVRVGVAVVGVAVQGTGAAARVDVQGTVGAAWASAARKKSPGAARIETRPRAEGRRTNAALTESQRSL
jgi:hypothetical protein